MGLVEGFVGGAAPDAQRLPRSLFGEMNEDVV